MCATCPNHLVLDLFTIIFGVCSKNLEETLSPVYASLLLLQCRPKCLPQYPTQTPQPLFALNVRDTPIQTRGKILGPCILI